MSIEISVWEIRDPEMGSDGYIDQFYVQAVPRKGEFVECRNETFVVERVTHSATGIVIDVRKTVL